METDNHIAVNKKRKQERLKLACTNILSHDSGLDFLIKLREQGGVEHTPVSFKNSNESYYYAGRHAVVNEIMQMIKKHDFQGYIRLLEYEQNLKQRKDDGN